MKSYNNNKWEKIKSKGLLHFIVSFGIVWALIVYCTLELIKLAIKTDDYQFNIFELVGWLLVGVIYGFIMWKYYHRIHDE